MSNYRSSRKRFSAQQTTAILPSPCQTFRLLVSLPSASASQGLMTHPFLLQPSLMPPALPFSPILHTRSLRSSPLEPGSHIRAPLHLLTTLQWVVPNWFRFPIMTFVYNHLSSVQPVTYHELFTCEDWNVKEGRNAWIWDTWELMVGIFLISFSLFPVDTKTSKFYTWFKRTLHVLQHISWAHCVSIFL